MFLLAANLRLVKFTLPVLLLAICATTGRAQAPRINTIFPAGAQAGQSVDVTLRGGGLVGVERVLVTGAGGVTAQVTGANAQVDEKARPLFQSKCTTCHEARSPATLTKTPEQWAATVDRMINQRGADIPTPERNSIVSYLQGLSKAGQITARVTVAHDAAPGLREIRLVTERGASTACAFEVGAIPEVTNSDTNTTPAQAQNVSLPVVVNGILAQSGDKDYFSFAAKKGQRLAFSLKAYRLNEMSQAFFNPVLYLYDADGKEIAKNLGRYGLDPLVDFVAPSDGKYILLVRDLLWKGSPASVYRLAMGALPYDGVLSPTWAKPGASLTARMTAQGEGDSGATSDPFALRVPDNASGLTMVSTPMGEAPILVRDLPDGGIANSATVAALPALFRGTVLRAGQVDVFKVRAIKGGTALELYARRLGSPLRAQVTIKNAKGNVVATRAAENDDDLRIPNAFPAPGEYTVEVGDADSGAGAAYFYCWEALDNTPNFQLTVLPDLLTLAPGSSTALLVRATQRDNLRGPVTLTVRGLPPGVTAGPAFLSPDGEAAFIPLTASADAQASSSAIVVEGKLEAAEGSPALVRKARPLEPYRVNNNRRLVPRDSQIVTVSPDSAPPFTLALRDPAQANLTFTPGQEIRVPVRIVRPDGFKGEIVLMMPVLPAGITGTATLAVNATQTEATLVLRAANNAGQNKTPNTTTQLIIAGYLSGSGNSDGAPLTILPPILVTLGVAK